MDVYNETFPDKPYEPFNYTGDFNNTDIFTKQGTAVITLEYGDAVEVIFQGTNMGAAESHPMHLHGYSFYVVGMGLGNFKNIPDKKYNLRDPPYLNTFALPKNGWTTIRFVANNPGIFSFIYYDGTYTYNFTYVIILFAFRNSYDFLINYIV